MKYLAFASAVLSCLIGMSACTLDESSIGDPPQSTAQQPVTTNPFFIQFADGCQMTFWCHHDIVGSRPAFCTFNNCNGSGNAHASAFCSNNCSAGTNCNSGNITNLGHC